MELPRVLIVTGIMAAGKSTVAQALAERLPRSVHLRGDVFRKMIVNGRAGQGPVASDEDTAQLALRYGLAATAADAYAAAGFAVIYQDILFGPDLDEAVRRLARWKPGVVVLAPTADVAASRDVARTKTGYRDWSPAAFDEAFRRETAGRGHWIDSGALSVEATVDVILARGAETRQGLAD
jgi:predicted kinase